MLGKFGMPETLIANQLLLQPMQHIKDRSMEAS